MHVSYIQDADRDQGCGYLFISPAPPASSADSSATGTGARSTRRSALERTSSFSGSAGLVISLASVVSLSVGKESRGFRAPHLSHLAPDRCFTILYRNNPNEFQSVRFDFFPQFYCFIDLGECAFIN